MGASDREVAPQVVQHPGARPTERMQTVDSIKSSVFRPTDTREDTQGFAVKARF